MKQFILIIVAGSLFLSCEKEENKNSTNNDSIASLNQFLQNQNGLTITEVIEEGTNKTPQFSSFTFLFNENGTVTATQSNQTIGGTYLVFRDDNKTELRMTFPTNSILHELSDDWYFITKSNTTIRFEDNGDIVQFQKQ